MKRIAGAALLALLILCGAAALLYRGERKEYRFGSGAEVAGSGLIEKGWVPEILPEGISDFRIRFDLDINRGCGRYAYGSAPFRIGKGLADSGFGEAGKAEAKKSILNFCGDMGGEFDLERMNPETYRWEGFLILVDREKKRVLFLIRERPVEGMDDAR